MSISLQDPIEGPMRRREGKGAQSWPTSQKTDTPAVRIQAPRRYHLDHAPTFDKRRKGSNISVPRCVRNTIVKVDANRRKSIEPALPTFNQDTSPSNDERKVSNELNHKYLVMGIFDRVDGRPQEQLVHLRNEKRLFMAMFLTIARMRGLGTFLSLKDVKYFAVFSCDSNTGSHKQLLLDLESQSTLHSLLVAYQSWSAWGTWLPWEDASISDELNIKWAAWIHSTLNHSSCTPTLPPSSPLVPAQSNGEQSHMQLSLEVALGWSPRRIAVVVFSPVVVSVIVGLVLNSRDWNDGDTINMAWVVATYIATSGGIVAALLAIVSEIKK